MANVDIRVGEVKLGAVVRELLVREPTTLTDIEVAESPGRLTVHRALVAPWKGVGPRVS